MPQFDTSTFVQQLFWLALIFGVLYFLVVRLTLPKVGRVIDDRENRVKSDLDAAEAAKGSADAVRLAYDEGMATARSTAQTQVALARAEAAKAAEVRMAALAAELDGKTDAAMARLGVARTSAQAALAANAAELTADAVRQIAGLVVDTPDIEAAIAEAARHG